MSDQDDPRSEGAAGQPPAQGDRRRYFAESMGSGQPGNRHRRRRAPGDPTTTGSIPIVRVGDSLPDPTIEYRTPERPAGEPSPYFQVQYRPTEVEGLSFTEPRTSPVTSEPPTIVNPPAAHARAHAREEVAPPPVAAVAPEPTGLFDILDATQDEPPYEPSPSTPPPSTQPPLTPPMPPVASEITDPHLPIPHFDEPSAPVAAYEAPAGYGAAGYAPAAVDSAVPARVAPEPDDFPDDLPDDTVERPMPARKRSRRVIMSVAIIAIVLVLVLSGIALKALGVFDSTTDYDSATGHGAALVEVQSDASIRDIGDTLAGAGVVGSRKAFVSATGTDTISAGFYKLPKGISAQAAVQKMQGADSRVGRIVIPDGRQLDTKKGADGQTTPGILEMIAKATQVTTDDGTYGVSVDELMKAADNATADQLGIPQWARETFDKLGNDHRRIEGLIAAGAWEHIDPRASATEILRALISDSDKRFTAWGLQSQNSTGLTTYQTLVTASIVEREARVADDFPKVARVILNRLSADQRLEMDSTANYTANVQNIDLAGAAYEDQNAWNTYQHKGLSITPIGAVGERALNATLNPATGDWLYFVTVDKEGTTLFSKTFTQHKKNRQVACKNKLLVTGCE